MKRLLLILCGCGLLVFLALQLIRPSIPAPAERAEVAAPAEATQVLRTSCYSCHSNERRLAWFDEIVPGYWLVRHDVLEAREHLNFSTLGSKPRPAQRAALFEAVNMAQLGAMPLKSFTALHPDARVDPAGLDKLKAFLAPWGDIPAAAPEPTEVRAPANTSPAPGGLAFDPSYTSWHLLSVTDRGDNNTFRFILGNDIAFRAAHEGKISPWPDGARFAKIAWQQRTAADGLIEPGAFIQIEMMEKDANRYRDSEGWGWGRWKGPSLTPYGENASVVKECTGCHAPMKRNDFVYTMPISAATAASNDQLNYMASTLPELSFDPFTAVPVTMAVDRSRGTISVLFRKNEGSRELLLVNWQAQDDPHWFGAHIPGKLVSFEHIPAVPGPDSGTYSRTFPNEAPPADPAEIRKRAPMIQQLSAAPFLSH